MKFYINVNDSDSKNRHYEEVEGKEIVIPGFEDFKFFQHKRGNEYVITEATTGLLIATGRTQKKALQQAIETIQIHTGENKKTLMKFIEDARKAGYISPLYKANKNKDEGEFKKPQESVIPANSTKEPEVEKNKKKEVKMSVYDIVLDKIVNSLEKGVAPWKKTWIGGKNINMFSKVPYHGVNVLLLNISMAINNFYYPYWLTFKQAQNKGWKIKKGAKSTIITFSKKIEPEEEDKGKEDKEDEEIAIIEEAEEEKNYKWVLRYYNVFNVEQVENYEDILAEETVEVEITRPDVTTFFENYLGIEGIKLIHKTDAYYSPKKDLISIPKMMSFVSEDAYYSTLAHEVIHSTGVEKRLHRFDDGSFREGREKYSQEELVAEIGSAYLCSDLGIEVDVDNSASYLNSWAKYLKESKKTAIFSASKQSEKAVAYVKDKANTKQQAA